MIINHRIDESAFAGGAESSGEGISADCVRRRLGIHWRWNGFCPKGESLEMSGIINRFKFSLARSSGPSFRFAGSRKPNGQILVILDLPKTPTNPIHNVDLPCVWDGELGLNFPRSIRRAHHANAASIISQ